MEYIHNITMQQDFIKNRLAFLKSKNLERKVFEISARRGQYITFSGRRLLSFASNDYLGISQDTRLAKAVEESTHLWGGGAVSSRAISGSSSLHIELESKLAEFQKTPTAVFFPTGYMTNIGLITTIVDDDSIIFSDEFNHASLIDAIKLTRATKIIYPHADMKWLKGMLSKTPTDKKRFIVTESVFSMNGDIVPLDKLIAIADEFSCYIILDEAHAIGVLGKHGCGARELFQIESAPNLFVVGTLSKAVGGMGGFVPCDKDLAGLLRSSARTYLYTTASPPFLCACNIKALQILQDERDRAIKLHENIKLFAIGLEKIGVKHNIKTPIIPILAGSEVGALKLSQYLLEEGFFTPAIRPPTVPENSCGIRVSLSSLHEKADIQSLIKSLEKAKLQGLLNCKREK